MSKIKHSTLRKTRNANAGHTKDGYWHGYPIQAVRLADIKPYENNPRKNDAAVPAVVASIKAVGFINPIVIDADNTIINGHTRRLAAIKLGMERVPCIKPTDLSPEQVRLLRLADNKVSEASSWDFGKLDLEIESLGGDFNMGDFGFEDIDDGDADALADGMGDDNPQTGDKEEEDDDDVGRLTVEIPRKYYGRASKWFRKGGKDEAAQFILVAAGCVNDDGEDETTDHEDDGEGDD